MNNENYIDYTIEEEVDFNKKPDFKNYPVLKIIAMVLGIIGALGYLYYSIKNIYQPYMEQFQMIEEYKAMGMVLGFIDLLPYYISMFSVALLIISPIVGSLLPLKYKSVSLILIMVPFAWQSIDLVPAMILYIAQGTPFSELAAYFVIIISSLLCLASAVLTLIAKTKRADDEFEIEYFEEYDDSYIEEMPEEETIGEEIIEEEIVEKMEDEAEELFDEVKEEIKEDKE